MLLHFTCKLRTYIKREKVPPTASKYSTGVVHCLSRWLRKNIPFYKNVSDDKNGWYCDWPVQLLLAYRLLTRMPTNDLLLLIICSFRIETSRKNNILNQHCWKILHSNVHHNYKIIAANFKLICSFTNC